MKKKRKIKSDPRVTTPDGYFLRSAPWVREQEPATSFISARDFMLFAFLILSTLAVGITLWVKPPKIISFDNKPLESSEIRTTQNEKMPRALKKTPGFDSNQFEEISENDSLITDSDEELPYEEEPAKEPLTIKS
jgi:hypothetical protein